MPFAFSKSNAASSTHMNAVCPALVPIVCTRVRSRGAQNENKRNKTKEGGHDGKVWSKAKLQDTVGIGATDNYCDKKPDDDGTNREFRSCLNHSGAGLGHERTSQLDVSYS